MCMYMHVCACVCVCTCICVYVPVYIYECASVCLYVYMCTLYRHTHTHSVERFPWSGSLHLSHFRYSTVPSTYPTFSKFTHKNWHPGPKVLNFLHIPQRFPWKFYFHSVLKVMEFGVRRTQDRSLTFGAIQTHQTTWKT